MDFTNPLVYGGPCFIIFILLELTYSKNHEEHHDLYDWNDLFASGFMGNFNYIQYCFLNLGFSKNL